MMTVIIKTMSITTEIIIIIHLQRFKKRQLSTKLIHNIQQDVTSYILHQKTTKI